MSTFRQHLFEMNVELAKSILGIDGAVDSTIVKKAFKAASIRNHPDKGGSTEMMQKVNQAYELLKNFSQSSDKKSNDMEIMAQRMKDWRDLSMYIITDLKTRFSIDTYTEYFNSIFGDAFESKIVKAYPDQEEITRLENKKTLGGSAPHHVYYKLEWSNKDRSKVLGLEFSVDIVSVYNASKGGLASNNTTYSMGVSTLAYIDGRKMKITSRDYTRTGKISIFDTPSEVFPKAKLIKKKKLAFKKSDMLTALTKELKASRSGDYYFIPIGSDRFVGLFRTTLMRKGYWSTSGIYERKPHMFSKDKTIDTTYGSFEENESTLELFREIQKMTPKNAIKFLDDAYKRLIAGL